MAPFVPCSFTLLLLSPSKGQKASYLQLESVRKTPQMEEGDLLATPTLTVGYMIEFSCSAAILNYQANLQED
jgi:hypothetical protein